MPDPARRVHAALPVAPALERRAIGRDPLVGRILDAQIVGEVGAEPVADLGAETFLLGRVGEIHGPLLAPVGRRLKACYIQPYLDADPLATEAALAHKGMKFGIFLAPFHRVGENPTLAIDRDMELIEWLDHLGYDEVWIGEHHSAGWELIASPEVFIAAAAERTKSHHAGLRGDEPALPPPAHGGPALRAARPHDARPRHARLRPRRARLRRVHDGHRAGDPAPAHGRVARRDHAAAPVRGAGHDEDRLVRAARGAAAPGALHRSALPDRGGQHHHAGRRDRRPASTASACSRSAPACPAAPRRSPTSGRSPRRPRPSTARPWTARSGGSSSTCTSPRTTSRRCARCKRGERHETITYFEDTLGRPPGRADDPLREGVKMGTTLVGSPDTVDARHRAA